ncbi:MAG: cytochrome b/b6 domain-containing protein [Candidatus Koribacter versatilis]|uniref:Cytochrome b/b6 domain-containing protein n=1 Tax=Candidatus Korobacter versatilis TaxID=658062 RepID=A0A932A6N3_9BACT|nr:cytochrome b/b6 domain-containing protein [Candidatus Koribacter versatilis]
MIADNGAGKTKGLQVDPKTFHDSIHGALECAACHADVNDVPHDPAPKPVACETCHADQHSAYQKGIHGAAKAKGVAAVPGCTACHGDAHSIVPAADPKSKVSRANIPQTCGACHGVKFVMEGRGLSAQPFLSYEQSVHGKAVAAGSATAAVCTDCHGAHDILRASDPKSPIFKFNVPQTCGRCHEKIAQAYAPSVHGEALARGNWQSAGCTDCHGIHSIKSHLDPESSVASAALARTTCAQCHEGVRLSQEFGVASQRASSYMDSYHGLASKMGSAVVANCASCHGVHNIYRSADPRSTVNHANLAATCGQCHGGSSQRFALTKVHVGVPLSKDVGSLGAWWVRRVYLWLIALVIGGMLLHNGLLWQRQLRLRRRSPERTVERMNARQRLQHGLVLVSFIALAVTGFALKYPDSPLAWLLGSSDAVRRIGHRVAAVVLMGVGLYHLVYVAFSPEGRRLFRDFLPTLQDATDLKWNLLYHLGRRTERPRFGRFTYGEKVEYLSLLWGTLLMAMTGMVLWFKVGAAAWWTGAAVDIATAIHFYEAILAVLAIVVWHFYQVMFDPDVYPVDWAFWDGKITEERAKEHHPRAQEVPADAPPNDEAPQKEDRDREKGKPGK